jgi:hypothetical protein
MLSASLMSRTGVATLHASGVTVLRFLPDTIQSLQDARENLAMAVKVGFPWLRPLLVDIRVCLPLPGDVRHFYGGHLPAENFMALALLFDPSPLGRMMSQLYLKVGKPTISTRLETNEEAAMGWLLGFAGERNLA